MGSSEATWIVCRAYAAGAIPPEAALAALCRHEPTLRREFLWEKVEQMRRESPDALDWRPSETRA